MKHSLEEEEARKVFEVLGTQKCKELLLLSQSDIMPILQTVFHAQKDDIFRLTPVFWQLLITCIYGSVLLPIHIDTSCQTRLSLGCPKLDDFLHGGLIAGQGQIFEFCGEAGVGKTQLMLQLSIVSQLKTRDGGLDSRVIYICTSGRFPSSRLQQLIAAFVQRYPYLEANSVASNIIVETVKSLEQLEVLVDSRLVYLLNNTDAKVIIIDSLARLFRETGLDALQHRSLVLHRLGIQLKRISYKHETLLLVTNEMTGQPAGSFNPHNFVQTPCLGKAWKHNVNHRFYLRKVTLWNAFDETLRHKEWREMEVAFSPEYDSSHKIAFQIRSEGICHI
ncbi:DNA repair protein XRCC3 [Galdieria sulphuraria]|uniref:DNA-repair protein XRCC3 n=1 Tax=Galdieria sulphuraria TaxID=130081 RepID=M2WZ68_GALSU|nr:DNA-repair protein XRCC3 [Galdieria sulphuraria]EME29355.1 DNA-repair protein XRCC3 [Galdieria sulphuraria]GJD05826.1 DNA repair protein XRCC3 [Galdieria sulphuraria]|eukprot:XP_005705875.1 DNA-repair protein XRCC3 [Galdieria sulphuraria]